MAKKKETVGSVIRKRRKARRKKAVTDILKGKTGNKADLGKKKKKKKK